MLFHYPVVCPVNSEICDADQSVTKFARPNGNLTSVDLNLGTCALDIMLQAIESILMLHSKLSMMIASKTLALGGDAIVPAFAPFAHPLSLLHH